MRPNSGDQPFLVRTVIMETFYLQLVVNMTILCVFIFGLTFYSPTLIHQLTLTPSLNYSLRDQEYVCLIVKNKF